MCAGPRQADVRAKPWNILCSYGGTVALTLLSPGEALGPQMGFAHGSPAGLAYICEGLKEQKKGLETLVLWNNQLTHTGMAFLGMTLVSRAQERGGGAHLCPPGLPSLHFRDGKTAFQCCLLSPSASAASLPSEKWPLNVSLVFLHLQ